MFYIKLFFARKLDQIIDIANTYVFHGDLEKIIEITYSYRKIDEGFLLNETLFEEYLWETYPQRNVAFLWRKYRYKIGVQIVLIEDILKKAKKIHTHSRSEGLRKWIFIEALEYVKNVLEISQLGIEFELEKAWIPHKLTPVKIRKKIAAIEKREKLAFGPKVIESTEEFSFCYNFVLKNHRSKQNSLSSKDQTSMRKYLKVIKKSAKCSLIDTPDIKRKILKGKFLKKEIIRKDYRKIFDTVCELYGLPQRTKITNAGSIYDGESFLEIPRDDSFSCFTIERILKLLTHEIESHYINSHNSKILLWNFRGSKNLPKEEGLAMFMEKIFHGYTYDTIDNIVEYFFTIMAGECLEWERFEDFMRIMWKEYNCKRSYTNAVIRSKRNYSPAYVWVQHKDVVYFRGLTETVNFLKQWGQFRKLFLWKVGFHDLENVYAIYENHERKDDIVFPIFISDLVRYYFIEQEKNKNFEFQPQEYYLYLKKKYWFLDLDCFNIIEQIEQKWKKIQKIIKLFQ